MTGLDARQIQERIPHRPPMLLVDEVTEIDEERLVAVRRFHADEYFFQGHYPGQPIVPGVILCESAMQAGAVLLSQFVEEKSDAVPVATRIDKVKFKRIVKPGDLLQHEIRLTEKLANAFFLTAKSTVDGQLAVRFEFACALADVE